MLTIERPRPVWCGPHGNLLGLSPIPMRFILCPVPSSWHQESFERPASPAICLAILGTGWCHVYALLWFLLTAPNRDLVSPFTVRLDSMPVLVREVPCHIRRHNVATLVPRKVRNSLGVIGCTKQMFICGRWDWKKNCHGTATWVKSMSKGTIKQRVHNSTICSSPNHDKAVMSLVWVVHVKMGWSNCVRRLEKKII